MRVSRYLGTKLFLGCGVLLFALGVVMISNRHHLFTKTFVVYADFARLNGIEKGATVRLSGLQAGEVLSTEITRWPEGRLRLKLELGENLHPYVRSDSVASIRTSGLAGSTFLDIQKGTPQAAEVADGGTLPTVEPIDLTDLMREGDATLRQARESLVAGQQRADATMVAVTALTEHVDGTVAAVRPALVSAAGSAQGTAANLRAITDGVAQGKGMAGEVLVDPALAASFRVTAANAEGASAQLREATARLDKATAEIDRRELLQRTEAILVSTQDATAKLDAMLTSTEGGAGGNLGETLAATERAMTNVADDTEAAKHNFLLRGFFKGRGYYELQHMTPAEYRQSKFLKGHTQQRSWLPAAGMFAAEGAGGAEVLTAEGKAAVDAAVGTMTAYLPNDAMMVEGYAEQGSPEASFRRSQARAALVKQYLVRRFGLSAELVGARAMGQETPAGQTDRRVWDGVSLVILTP